MGDLRAQANLTISFGLVNIGVSIQKMIEDDNTPESHLYCATHKSRLTQQYVCSSHNEVVPKEEQVSGYVYDDKTVYLTDSDKAACQSDKDKMIALTRYVEVEDIDPLYFTDKSYFVWSQKGHEDGFALLAEELQESGKALVGKSVLNKTTRLMVLRWSEEVGTLVAHLAQYDANVRRHLGEAIQERAKAANPEAKALVKTIMASLGTEFDSAEVTDEYSERLRNVIANRASGKDFTPTPSSGPVNVPDIMAALRASVAEVGEKKPRATSKASKTKAAPKKSGAASKKREKVGA